MAVSYIIGEGGKRTMKTPVIRKPSCKSEKGNGSFGSYFVLDAKKKVGVKVLFGQYTKVDIEYQFESFLNARDVNNMQRNKLTEAAREIAAIQMLADSGKTPKPIGLCWVKSERCYGNPMYAIGIMMEHISGSTAYRWSRRHKKEDAEIVCEFRSKHRYDWVDEYGVDVGDWHSENILMDRKGNPYRIDFSPGYFAISDAYKEEYGHRVMYEVLSMVENFPS
jgi:RIO-like serine/threonine protein kinase